MPDAALPFGAELHATLRETDYGVGILSRFSFAERQTLEASNREEVLALLAPYLNHAQIQRLEAGSPRDVADFLCSWSPVGEAIADPSLPFGAQLYEELRRRGMGRVVTGDLTYSEVQEFKQADRGEVLELLRASLNYSSIQRLKQLEPAAFADFLCMRQMQMTANAGGVGSWPFWLFFLVMS